MNTNKDFKTLINTIDKFNNRFNWNEYFMSIAKLVSARSSCKKLKVGCVIVKNKRIMCTGYNGHVAGIPHMSIERNGHEQMTIHSEINAICHSAKDGINISDSIAYVTHFPCINCSKALIASGIKHIIYLNEYKMDDIAINLLKISNIKIEKMEN